MESLQCQRLCVFVILLLLGRGSGGREQHRKPNFVIVMVDDLGIGDIGCYGNDTMRTPNIDRLAQDGVKLSQHIAAAPLCTPSRAAFMTGRYPVRSGMAGAGRVRVVLFLAGSGGLPTNETTFAKLLQKQGYTTGIIGKWHLGVSCETRNDHCHHPNKHGFDYFYGMPFTNFNECKPGERKTLQVGLQEALWDLSLLLGLVLLSLLSAQVLGLLSVRLGYTMLLVLLYAVVLAVWYVPFELLHTWNCVVMRNGDVVEQPVQLDTLTPRIVDEAERFLHRNRHSPFLLFLSLIHVHTPLFASKEFAGKSRHGPYGDNVEEADWIIGRVVESIEKLNLSRNTLIHFTSDHGGSIEESDHRGQKGGWNGIYKGGKGMGGWEGGIRVPGLFRWPGHLPSSHVIDEPTSLMDLLPTLVSLAGGELPRDRILDGHDLMPLLEGKLQRSDHEFMFHYCGTHLHAVRWHPPDSNAIFKAHFFTPNFFPEGSGGCFHTNLCNCDGDSVTRHDPPLLFDLSRDPSEGRPLSSDMEPRHSEALRRIGEAVWEHRRSVAPVGSQMSWDRTLWRPWLQPCCGTFPLCSCTEARRAVTQECSRCCGLFKWRIRASPCSVLLPQFGVSTVAAVFRQFPHARCPRFTVSPGPNHGRVGARVCEGHHTLTDSPRCEVCVAGRHSELLDAWMPEH